MGPHSRARRSIPYAIFVAVLCLGLALAFAIFRTGVTQRRAQLANDLDDVAGAVEIKLAQNAMVIRAVKALLQVETERVTRAVFSRFVATIDLPRVYPGLRGVGFAPLFPVGQEEAFERRYDLPTPIHPATDQSLRAPVAFLEPMDARNAAALGYDMYSEPLRRAAMQTAQDRDELAATAPLRLVQEITADVQTGFLLYLPVRGADGAMIGFAYAPFRMGDFLAGAGLSSILAKYVVSVVDVSDAQPHPLYGGPAEGATLRHEIDFAGRRWRISLSDPAGWSRRGEIARSLAIAILALILAALVAHSYRDQMRAQETQAALSEARARALAEREVLLQEMNHRIKNAIARIGAIARSTLRGSTSLDEFQRSFAGRLAAMAAAQDILTRSNDAGATLAELLQAELGQIFPEGDLRLTLKGEPVFLDARLTQALALLAHELATNAGKYGAARDPDGRLDVSWTRDGAGTLTLDWVETCAVTPGEPNRKGFGSRLIEMVVTGELNGKIERELRPNGLRLHVELPEVGAAPG